MTTKNSPEVLRLYQEGLQLYRDEALQAAKEKLEHVLSLDSHFEDAYEALSVILYNQKKYDEAIDWIKKWLKINPHSIMLHTNLSRCYVGKGMIMEAEQAQAEARRLTWREDLKTKKQSMPKVDYKEKIARYKQVIELDPKDVLGYYSLGQVYSDAGKKREAVDTFEKAISVDPNHSSSFLGLGLALEGLGDNEKALRIYRQGIRVADQRGDIMPQKKMESRLKSIESPQK